jgi:hypothetical protein
MTTVSSVDLKRLKGAYQVCHDCGIKYGEARDHVSTYWHDKCDVCGAETSVTEARDYGFLWKGIRELEANTEKMNESTEFEIKYKSQIHSISITRQEDDSFLGTEVRIENEGGGRYLMIIDDEGNEIRLDFEEFDLLVKAVETLRNQ